MKAFVTGKVLSWVSDSEIEIVVKSEKGAYVVVDINDVYAPELPDIIGKEVDIEGDACFDNGEFVVSANTIRVDHDVDDRWLNVYTKT